MRIGFIGAGRVGTAFGRYLHGRGITISGYLGRHASQTDFVCATTQSRAFADYRQIAAESDLILITTRDDQIKETCAALRAANSLHSDHFIGHMSGVHSSTLLSQVAETGAAVFSLHPLQAFARQDRALHDLQNTYFSLEGRDARLISVEKLLKQINNPYFRLAPEQKILYHLAACVFSNYLVTVIDFGMRILSHSGVPEQQGFEAMIPLIQSTLSNITALGPQAALTGPIARGDVLTITGHLEALGDRNLEQDQKFYKRLGQETLALAVRQVLADTDKAQALYDLFNQ